MTTNKLIQYLTMIVDLEENCYLQKKLIEKLENGLAYDLTFRDAGAKPFAVDYKPSTFYFNKKKTIIISLISAFFLGFLFAVVSGNILLMTGNEDIYYNLGVGMLFLPSFIASIFILYFGIYSIAKSKHARKEQAKLNIAKKTLADEQRAYEETVKYTEEYNKKITIQRTLMQTDLEKLREKYKESLVFLGLAYAKNIIYPKYQNYVAVSTILDYLMSGRCSQLEGHEGAYNLYENESRMNCILTKLDDVVNAVKQVSQGQFLLAQSIENSNRRLNNLYEHTLEATNRITSLETGLSNMAENIENLNKTSAIAAYNAERIAKEVSYRNIKDNIYTAL